MTRSRRLALGVAFAVAAITPAAAIAQQPLLFGSWSVFEWFLGIGPVEGDGFSVSSATDRIRLRVTDAGFSGDAFDIFVNGSPFTGGTPTVTGGVDTGALTGSAAYADARLSKREMMLDPGQYIITMALRENASGFDYGEGFMRADRVRVDPPPNVIPEPATVALVAAGLAGVAFAARRRRAI